MGKHYYSSSPLPFVDCRMDDCQIVSHTSELSMNSLVDFEMFWNYDSHTVFQTTELSTNSLVDFVV